MLINLYDYAERNNLIIPEGFVYKSLKAFILLYPNGDFQDVELVENDEYLTPDIGTLAQSKDKCNVIVEKRAIVIRSELMIKREKFIKSLRSFAANQPLLSLMLAIIENNQVVKSINKRLQVLEVDGKDKILFRIGDKYIINQSPLPKGIKAFVQFSTDGQFEDVFPLENFNLDYSEIIDLNIDSSILLRDSEVFFPDNTDLNNDVKNKFFISALLDAAKYEPHLSLCVKVLEDENVLQIIRERLDALKIKKSDRISFKVGGLDFFENRFVQDWWQNYRLELIPNSEDKEQPCFITGNFNTPMRTTPKINGLHFVGGHSSGDSLISFDKRAYESYGLKQAANAPVSEEAMLAVKVALDSLLEKAPELSGMKFVHWYDKTIPEEADLITKNLFDLPSNFIQFGDETNIEGTEANPNRQEEKEADRNAKKHADNLINSVSTGKRVRVPDDLNYFILLLTGVGGRVMIRRFDSGNYRDLQDNIHRWQDDLSLCKVYTEGYINPCKLNARLFLLLSHQKTNKNLFERAGKELAGVTPVIIEAILKGYPLPDSVAQKALFYIRSAMYDDSQEESNGHGLFTKDSFVWQWLKVWLLRNKEKRGILMSHYNENYKSATNAYHCGAMLAVYEAIQKKAMPDVNVTVVQRYYSSAIQTPALVLGRLSQLSIHHLAKIENEYVRYIFNSKLNNVSTHIQGSIPTTLGLEGQAEFALGYYQMTAELEREKREAIAAKKEKKED